MPDLKIQFAVYAPGGERRGVLPYPLAANIADVLNDIGSGSIDYLADVPRAPMLEELCEVAVEAAAADGSWSEFGARMLRLKRGGSVIDETRTRRYNLFSYGYQLGKVRMLREETLNANGERVIIGASPGQVLKTLIDEAKGRGNIPGLTYSFTNGADSAGVPWGDVMAPVTLRYGDDLLALMRTMGDNGHIDWRFVGRELQVFKADGVGATRAVTLHNHRDLIEAPDDEDATEMAGRIGVHGDEGRTYEAISPSAGPWGLWEELVSAAGIKDIGGLQYIGEVEQARRSQPRVQMTRGLRVTGVPYLPHVDYGIGDTITAPDDRGVLESLRVRQITLGLSRDGVSANLVLNDRFLEKDIRTRRAVTGMLGGASSSSGSSGLPNGDDKRPPKVPVGFVVSSAHLFTPEGVPFALIDSAFVPVTQGTDNLSLDVTRHELYARENVVGEPWRKLTEAPTGVSRITYSPLPAGEQWQFKLRAVSRQGVIGDFTDPVLVELAKDTTPPPRPATPTAEARMGLVTVKTTGRDTNGAPMPVDFARFDVWIGPSPGRVVGSMRLSGGDDAFHVDGLEYGDVNEFWLTAVDTSGNVSAASARVSAMTAPLVEGDLADESITTGKIAANAITADKIKAGSITAVKIAADAITSDKVAAGAIEAEHLAAGVISADLITAGSITSEKIAAGAITAQKIAAGAITADTLAADAITGKTITGGEIRGSAINGATISAEGALVIHPWGSMNFPYVANGVWYNSYVRGRQFGTLFEGGIYAQGGLAASMALTSLAANVRSDSNTVELKRVSSMRDLKLEREEIQADYRLLDLPARTWRDSKMAKEDPEASIRVAGFVAEDLATVSAFHGGTFDSLLELDADGRAIGIQYDRMAAFLFPMIRDLHERVQALEAAS